MLLVGVPEDSIIRTKLKAESTEIYLGLKTTLKFSELAVAAENYLKAGKVTL